MWGLLLQNWEENTNHMFFECEATAAEKVSSSSRNWPLRVRATEEASFSIGSGLASCSQRSKGEKLVAETDSAACAEQRRRARDQAEGQKQQQQPAAAAASLEWTNRTSEQMPGDDF